MTMQHSLKLLILLAAATFPALTFADLAGIPLPSAIPAESVVSTYGAAFAVLLACLDYSRAPRTLRLPSPILVPAAEAFATGSAGHGRLAPRRLSQPLQCG